MFSRRDSERRPRLREWLALCSLCKEILVAPLLDEAWGGFLFFEVHLPSLKSL